MKSKDLQGKLEGLIGLELEFLGEVCQVIEVLEEPPALVLQCSWEDTVIQSTQFGDANRRVPRTITIPVFRSDGSGLHPDFQALEIDPDKYNPAGQ